MEPRNAILWILLVVLVVLAMSAGAQAQELREVPASEILEKIQAGEDVNYTNVRVTGELDLSKIDLETVHIARETWQIENWDLEEELKMVESEIVIRSSIFENNTDFSNTQFKKPVDFLGTSFIDISDFRGVSFADYADFRCVVFYDANFGFARFGCDADFGYASFGGYTEFAYAVFGGNASFGDANFVGVVRFGSASFGGEAYFGSVIFSSDASFGDASFAGDAIFGSASFGGDAYFGSVIFSSDANFWSVIFRGDADFWSSSFGGDACFKYAGFGGTANFMSVSFGGTASFMCAVFVGDADFGYAVFVGDADFWSVIFRGDANFWSMSFDGDAIFNSTEFDKVTFSNTTFTNISLYGADFKTMDVDWASLKDTLLFDGLSYIKLIKNFREVEQFKDADDAYYQYRRLSQANKEWSFSKLGDIFMWLSCGYGVKPQYTIILAVILILIFTTIYWVGNGIRRLKKSDEWRYLFSWDDVPGKDNERLIRYLGNTFSIDQAENVEIRKSYDGETIYISNDDESTKIMIDEKEEKATLKTNDHETLYLKVKREGGELNIYEEDKENVSFCDAFYFSVVTFTTVGYGDWYPKDHYRKFVMIEGLVGWLTLALFLVTLANVMIRP